jgi:hypothetical protein
MPQWPKEPSYFSTTYVYGYKNRDGYLRLFADARDERAVGEASTAYLTSPESPDRIREAYPSAKIIAILRNPVDRAYSLYLWMAKEGYEWIASFERALIAEESRLLDQNFKRNNPQYYHNYLYFHSGEYAAQIERYAGCFAKDSLLLLLFDDLTKDPVSTTQRVFGFLGVDPGFVPTIGVHNRSQYVLSAAVQYFAKQKLPRLLKNMPRSLVDKAQKAIFNINLSLGQEKEMNPNTRQELVYRYYSDIEKTSALMGRDLGHWLRCR